MFKRITIVMALFASSCGAGQHAQEFSVPQANAQEKIRLKSVAICDDNAVGLGLLAPSCSTTKSISHLLESGSVAFGTITAYCAIVPEPTVSKFTMAALAVGTGVTQLLKFVVDNIPCEKKDDPFTPEERQEIEKIICKQAGGKLVLGECFKPN